MNTAYSPNSSDAWDNFSELLRQEIPESRADFSKMEKKLMDRIRDHSEYEQTFHEVIAESETNLSAGKWESIETQLFQRIHKVKPPLLSVFWLFNLIHVPAALKKSSLTALVLVVMFFLGMGTYITTQKMKPEIENLSTLVYRAEGSALNDIMALQLLPGTRVRANPYGSLTLVNSRGFVKLQQGSEVQIVTANTQQIEYAFDSPVGSDATGPATFFVDHKVRHENFWVSTPEYRIEVTGTYFQVSPNNQGRFETTVFEGSVNIRTVHHGRFTVSEGQSLTFDVVSNRYAVKKGGMITKREDIPILPKMENLAQHAFVSISSSLPGTEVKMNGKILGHTPFASLQPQGLRRFSLKRDGYSPVDTIIELHASHHIRFHAQLNSIPLARNSKPVLKITQQQRIIPNTKMVDSLFAQAEQMQNRHWKSALKLYESVYTHPQSSLLRKDAALFAIATMVADSAADVNAASDAFVRYLKIFPSGSFVGETWLRLGEIELSKNTEKAMDYYNRYITAFPRRQRVAELHHRIGLILLQQNKAAVAESRFRKALTDWVPGSRVEKREIHTALNQALLLQGKSADSILP